MSAPDIAGACARYDDGDGEAERLAADVVRRLEARRSRGKVCGRCEERKPVRAFGVDSRELDGLHRLCRVCRSTGPLL